MESQPHEFWKNMRKMNVLWSSNINIAKKKHYTKYMVKTVLLNYVMVEQERMAPNVRNAQLKSLHPKQMKIRHNMLLVDPTVFSILNDHLGTRKLSTKDQAPVLVTVFFFPANQR